MSSSKRARRNRYRRNQEVTRKFVKAVARKTGVLLRVFSGDVGKSLAVCAETYWKEDERRLRAGMELLMKGWMNNPCNGLIGPRTYTKGEPTTGAKPTESRPEVKPT